MGEALLTMPLFEVEKRFLDASRQIEAWLEGEWQKTPPPLYASVDLRHAGFKLAPVDTNLFPAGFNNLPLLTHRFCVRALKEILDRQYPNTRKILLIPEGHTRNPYYLENVAVLRGLFLQAGFELRIGSFGEKRRLETIELASGKRVSLEPIVRVDNTLQVKAFVPDLIVLNLDLIEGIPDLLKGLTQPITPPLRLGWSERLKSRYFECYWNVVETLGDLIGLDPWLFAPLFQNCGEVNFKERVGEVCLEKQIEFLLLAMTDYYERYAISEKPYVVVKTDAGSYGLGVMKVYEAKSIRSLNRRERKEMATTKGGTEITKVIIQEGVYTEIQVGDPKTYAEPVIYTIGSMVVGGFYRTHPQKGRDDNLNAPGMRFVPMVHVDDLQKDRFYVYGLVARLALLAAAREIQG